MKNNDHQFKKIADKTKMGPYLCRRDKLNPDTGKEEFDTFTLSDESVVDDVSFLNALKNSSGSTDITVGDQIIRTVANGLSEESAQEGFNKASSMLSALKPQNETEGMLLGQFLALQDSAMKCLRRSHSQDTPEHVEKLLSLSTKLFNAANQTMQTVMKYRSGGKQTVQVVHVHNEGQAIVAQNLQGGGDKK